LGLIFLREQPDCYIYFWLIYEDIGKLSEELYRLGIDNAWFQVWCHGTHGKTNHEHSMQDVSQPLDSKI
jgi:hypothetical protein